jgi:hypothetical protein
MQYSSTDLLFVMGLAVAIIFVFRAGIRDGSDS